MHDLLDALPLAAIVIDDDRIVEWNAAAEMLYGHDRAAAVGASFVELLFEPSDRGRITEILSTARRGGSWEGDFRVCRRDGVLLVSEFRLAGIGRGRAAWLAIDRMDHALAEEERAVLLSAEHAARATAEEARHRLAVLATAGSVLTSTMNVGAMLERLARVLAPAAADFCVIELIDSSGALENVAVAHQDPMIAEELRATILKEPFDLTRRGPIAEVVATRRARRYEGTQLSDALDATSRQYEQARINQSLGLNAAILAPIEARGIVLGVLGLAVAGSRSLTEDDLELAIELAHRAALALTNAKAYEQEREIAETLQRALLPSTLPPFSGIEVAVRYLTAAGGVDVGGDWYDVIPLTDSCVGLVIGDVIGHDVRAASAMGQVRNALRAFVIDGSLDPMEAMARTDRLMDRLGLSLATSVLMVVDVDARTISWSNAGHPSPLLLRGARVSYLDDGRRLLLGGGWPSDAQPATMAFAAGDTIVLYTDGLVERRGESLTEGLERLARTARSGLRGTVEELGDHLLAQMVPPDDELHDDIALLVARLT